MKFHFTQGLADYMKTHLSEIIDREAYIIISVGPNYLLHGSNEKGLRTRMNRISINSRMTYKSRVPRSNSMVRNYPF